MLLCTFFSFNITFQISSTNRILKGMIHIPYSPPKPNFRRKWACIQSKQNMILHARIMKFLARFDTFNQISIYMYTHIRTYICIQPQPHNQIENSCFPHKNLSAHHSTHVYSCSST